MKKNRIFILGLILSVIPFLLGIIFYDKLPDNLATHFDFQGRPNGYSGKNTALFFLPLFLTFGYILMYFFTIKDPKHKNHDKKLNSFMFLLLPIINVLTNALIIAVGLGREIQIHLIVPVVVGIIFIIVGNFMPKVKRNYTIGIKLPWTLDSDLVWEKTHRLAGYLWMMGGVFIIVSNLLAPDSIQNYFLFSTVLFITIIPAIYSYILYKKEAAK